MQLVKEFWFGFFGAVVGASLGFAVHYYSSTGQISSGALPIVLACAVAGFVVFATPLQWRAEGIRKWAAQMFGVDLRALAVLRIGVAIAILVDLAMRARDLEVHYGGSGILPLDLVVGQDAPSYYRPTMFSLHVLSGEVWFQAMLFVVTAIVAVLMLIGYRTRIVTIICWFLIISLHSRNPLVITGGDTLVRMLLFWGMFLPLGARYSVDSALNVSLSRRKTRIADAATFALLVQLVCMYFFTGLLKTHAYWHVDGSAVYYALNLDMLTTSFGQYLLNYPILLRGMNFLVLYLELASPFLIFMPWRNGIFRFVFFALFFCFHFGFWLSMWIGIFPFLGMVAVSMFLPMPIWDWLSRLIAPSRDRRPVIYYDQQCSMRKKWALLLREFFMLRHVRIRRFWNLPLSDQGTDKDASGLVVHSRGRFESRFAAILALMRATPVFYCAACVLSLKPIAAVFSWIYGLLARRKTWWQCCSRLLPISRVRVRPFLPVQPLVAFFVVYIVLFNMTTLDDGSADWFQEESEFTVFGKRLNPRFVYNAGRHLRLDQNWRMFAPYPLMQDGWYVAKGRLEGGGEVNAWSSSSTTFEKPATVADTYPNNRWRKCLEGLRFRFRKSDHRDRVQLEFCRYICQRWNRVRDDDERLLRVELYFVMELSVPPHVKREPEARLLKRCVCDE